MRSKIHTKTRSSHAGKVNKRRRPLSLESLEERVVMSASFAEFDGTGNNLDNPEWGSTYEQLLRISTVEYADGISDPAGADRPSAREVSNAIVDQDSDIINDRQLSDFVWLWGQFIDHDIDLTENGEPHESLPIEVPTGDEYFDPFSTGTEVIDFNRSLYDTATGDSVSNVRQQLNEITAFIDGSAIYGSDDVRAAALRTFSGGRLKTSEGDLLPFNESGLANAGGTSADLFLAGDVRANENVALSSMHTLFVREHNRIADEIAANNPGMSDEAIYQQARAFVVAEMQAITFNEYLPALLGEGAIAEYQGYDPTVNPGISNLFSTAAYRYGHSMLSPELLRVDNSGAVIDAGNLSLRDAFFAPGELTENGIDSLLAGLARQEAQEIDTQVIDDVRNFLFGPPGSGGFDLVSLNIQRGRDHGLADYNQVRVDLGLEAVTSFSQITSDPELQAKLEEVYGDVDNIDVWVGGLAEDHVAGASVGLLIHTVIADQFERIRDGDRFWYQNVFEGSELEELESTKLSDIILRNTGIENIREDVFRLTTNYAPVAAMDVEFVGSRRNGELQLDASSSYDLEQSTDSLTYLWDLDNDGKYDDAVGMQAAVSMRDLDSRGRLVVGLKVIDDQGNVGLQEVAVENGQHRPGHFAGGMHHHNHGNHNHGHNHDHNHGKSGHGRHGHQEKDTPGRSHKGGKSFASSHGSGLGRHDDAFAELADGLWGNDLLKKHHRRSR
ncbi:peroxidase [Symmachiella dynata]|uniref:peroxidase family protein n=1 Tax=Symmachiella dynata TaxID=2527995 RepID=UPI00118C7289|nr:peroxidase family protein [Symmachiella dynata]QDT48597.1 peroxidase [Symmachiella dynata]